MKRLLFFSAACSVLFAISTSLFAQTADAPPPKVPAPASGNNGNSSSNGGNNSGNNGGNSNGNDNGARNNNNGQSSFLGRDTPFFDPGSEIVTWDGKNWNINNNRIFAARFEKYLSAPAESSKDDLEYDAVLEKIRHLLAPAEATPKNIDEAFKLLTKASEYQRDANLCDTIGNQVYSAWSAQRSMDRLTAANEALEEDRKRLEWNSKMTVQGSVLDADAGSAPGAKSGGAAQAVYAKNAELKRTMEMQPLTQRLAEINAVLKANQLKREVSALQAKMEFQAFIIQLFLQRRFQHVVIATRFYRSVFTDGETQLHVGAEAKNLFSKTTGMPPTISTVDSMANEIMHDVQEGINAFNFLLEKNELESASKRLAETFLIGEYLPPVRTLDRDKKRKVLAFEQKTNQLISAIEVKDYTLAENLVKGLQQSATDFDNSKPMAAIETARNLASLHLAKAKNAAVSGDKETLETELKEATEIWPRNPDLKEVAGLIFSQGDVQQRAIVDFEQLLSQRNYRQIYDDKARFIAATATNPEKAKQLQKVLEDMTQIESSMIRAQEIEKHGDYAGAWESAEMAFKKFPDDNKLNQIRADLTTKAASFVNSLKRAEELEAKEQYGSSLAWFLKAKQEYPNSEFADDGINRIVKKLFPDAK
ncbi:MAG: hypothetical protein ABI443_03495 [Chthoniobacterales bacterium]